MVKERLPPIGVSSHSEAGVRKAPLRLLYLIHVWVENELVEKSKQPMSRLPQCHLPSWPSVMLLLLLTPMEKSFPRGLQLCHHQSWALIGNKDVTENHLGLWGYNVSRVKRDFSAVLVWCKMLSCGPQPRIWCTPVRLHDSCLRCCPQGTDGAVQRS